MVSRILFSNSFTDTVDFKKEHDQKLEDKHVPIVKREDSTDVTGASQPTPTPHFQKVWPCNARILGQNCEQKKIHHLVMKILTRQRIRLAFGNGSPHCRQHGDVVSKSFDAPKMGFARWEFPNRNDEVYIYIYIYILSKPADALSETPIL